MGRHTIVVAAIAQLIGTRPSVLMLGSGTSLEDAARSAQAPELVIIDIDDLIVSPNELIARCRSLFPQARICVLSGCHSVDSLRASISAGADGYVAKESSVEELFRGLDTVNEGISYVDPRVGAFLLLTDVHHSDHELSPRELEIVRHVAEGMSNREISVALTVSEKTVKNHMSRIFSKLNMNARAQIAAHAIRVGIA